MSQDYEGDERQEPTDRRDYRNQHFHLKKEITWGHVVTTIFLVGGMFGLYTDNIRQHQLADKRISVIESQMQLQHEQMMQVRTMVDTRLTSIDAKLDRIVDRMLDK